MLANDKSTKSLYNTIMSCWLREESLSCSIKPLLSSNEAARLKALRQYQILDTEPEEAFDDITRLAAHICDTPIALISLVDAERQCFKSKVGMDATETPRNVAFCNYTILQSDVLIVPNTLNDERFATNPLVTSDPYIRFYAGATLITPEGYGLGTLCVIDRVPRELEPQQVEALRTLSRQVSAQLELRRNLVNLVRANEELQESEERFRLLVEGVKDYGIFLLDPDGRIVSWNAGAERIKGYRAEEILGQHFSCFYNAEDIKQGKPEQGLRVACVSGRFENEGWRVRKDGSRFWANVIITALHDRAGQLRGFSKVTRDITERKQAESARLRAQVMEAAKLELEKEITSRKRAEERLAKLNACFLRFGSDPNENINHLTVLCGELLGATYTLYNRLDGGLLCTSSQWNAPADYNPVDKPDGHICYDAIESGGELLVVSDLQKTHYAQTDPNVIRYQLQTYIGHPIKCGEVNVGSLCAVYQNAFVPSDEDKKLISIVASAIGVEEERKRAESQLLHHAFHDALTGLPNRALLMDRLGHTVERAKRHGHFAQRGEPPHRKWPCQDCLFAVLFLDLDRFQVINDSLGHMLGDQLLIAFAHRLKGCLRPGDTVARLGGDEFAILLTDIQEINDATHIASRLQHELTLPFNLSGHEVFTTVSIGIALSTTGYDQPEDILRDADTAMYRAKVLGKARYEVFNQTMHTWAVTRLQLENDLRRAVERQEFQLHYQPIVSLKTGFLNGFEALVRWQHPTRGLVSPAEFIPAAEETGLIFPIGYWVLRSACRQMRAWQLQFPASSPLTISVNLSGKQFSQPDLIEQIGQILQESGLDACSLKLEITESVIMENTKAATSLLQRLKALGIHLCIDDFGTCYSSLSYLRSFPIDTLKIDRSFVSHMEVGDENVKIVQTIVTLAHNLGMAVTAEGVETAEQLAKLRELKCEFGQGYFFDRPLDDLEAWALIADYYLDCLI